MDGTTPAPPPVAEEPDTVATWGDLLVCERCHGPLGQPGALVFSPPLPHVENATVIAVRKHHLCHWCYPVLLSWMAVSDDLTAADAARVQPQPDELRAQVTEALDLADEALRSYPLQAFRSQGVQRKRAIAIDAVRSALAALAASPATAGHLTPDRADG